MKDSARQGAKTWEFAWPDCLTGVMVSEPTLVNCLPGRHSDILAEHIDVLPWI